MGTHIPFSFFFTNSKLLIGTTVYALRNVSLITFTSPVLIMKFKTTIILTFFCIVQSTPLYCKHWASPNKCIIYVQQSAQKGYITSFHDSTTVNFIIFSKYTLFESIFLTSQFIAHIIIWILKGLFR